MKNRSVSCCYTVGKMIWTTHLFWELIYATFKNVIHLDLVNFDTQVGVELDIMFLGMVI